MGYLVLALLLAGPALAVGVIAHRRGHNGSGVALAALLELIGTGVFAFGLVRLAFHGYADDGPPGSGDSTLGVAIPALVIGAALMYLGWKSAAPKVDRG